MYCKCYTQKAARIALNLGEPLDHPGQPAAEHQWRVRNGEAYAGAVGAGYGRVINSFIGDFYVSGMKLGIAIRKAPCKNQR